MAGIVAIFAYASPDSAVLAEAIETLGRIILHATQALSLFGGRAVNPRQEVSELGVAIPMGQIDATGAAIETARRHEPPVLELIV